MSQTRMEYEAGPTMVGLLCETEARMKIFEYIHNEIQSGNTEPRKTGAIMEVTDLARTSVTRHIELFVALGLFNVHEDEDSVYEKYEPNDGQAYETLLRLDRQLRQQLSTEIKEKRATEITTLYNGESRRILTDFFIFDGMDIRDAGKDPTAEPLTKQDIYDYSGVTRQTVIEEIDTLLAYEVVKRDTEFSYDRYYPNTDSELFDQFVETNQTLHRLLDEYEQEQKQKV